MKVLKLVLFLAIAFSPVIAAAIADPENRTIILTLLAALSAYVAAILGAQAIIRRLSGRFNPALA